MRCTKSQKLYNMATVPLQICNGTDRCCKNFIVLYSLFSLLSLHFFFSLLSLSSSLSLLPVLVPSLFDQSEMFTSNDNGVAPATTARSATLDQPRSISLMLSHARSHRSHPEAAVDLTLFPLLSVRLSLCLSLVVGFFFFFGCNLGWSDGGGGPWAMGGDSGSGGGLWWWWLSVLLMIMGEWIIYYFNV